MMVVEDNQKSASHVTQKSMEVFCNNNSLPTGNLISTPGTEPANQQEKASMSAFSRRSTSVANGAQG